MQDPQVKALLAEPQVQNFIKHLQTAGGVDFHDLCRRNPELAQKIQFLMHKGIFNSQRTMP